YHIGKYIGPRVFKSEKSRFFNRKHLERAQAFYDKYGSKAIVLARFIPIVRTFAPFVAGIGKMPYRRFWVFNALGGVLWVSLFLTGGYCLGDLPAVKNNSPLVIFGIIFVSLLPVLIEWWRARKAAAAPTPEPAPEPAGVEG